MARTCSIPCSIGGVEARIRARALGDALPPFMPIIGVGLALAVASAALIALATWQVTVVAMLFFLLGVGVMLGRAALATQDGVRLGVPAELDRIIDEHEAEIHQARLPALRAQAVRLTYDSSDYRTRVTQLLQELRETTGEAWRCPCKKRRLPIPLPF